MNAVTDRITLTPGQRHGGGIVSHVYMHGAERRVLILAPKADGHFADVAWHEDYANVAGALSFYDGLANTEAMAAAGSELAKKVRALRVGDRDDWHVPALDQLEPAYRLLKPGTKENYCWARSGINLSSVPATWPYTPDSPAQTDALEFRKGYSEAFEEGWYWTSTQYASNRTYAWMQVFSDGNQLYNYKDNRCFARAVRSEPI